MADEEIIEAGGGPGGPDDEHPVDYFEKKERKKSRRGDEASMGLNITSLMDAITLVLVFLLVTITSDPLNVKQDDYMKLAISTAEYNPEDAIPITITKQNILMDNQAIVKVDCTASGQICQPEDYKEPGAYYSIDKSYKEDGSESSFLIEPLHKKLEEVVKQQKEEAKELEREFKPVATIICDKDIPFRLLAEIVHTTGMAGLSDLRFAIVKTTLR
jgi:biopolymer transport protein ExbD